jgi:hypothetical protein
LSGADHVLGGIPALIAALPTPGRSVLQTVLHEGAIGGPPADVLLRLFHFSI